MGITGLLPFMEKASRRANVSEFTGCTVAVDTYCWLHKGAFACADKLVRGEETDIHIKYCLKYVTMLLSRNIKPILVFDGRHLPAKAMTEAKRRESRNISKKRAAELLSLGKIEEARSYMRRSVDITHAMALCLIKECRKRNVDCIVAPYEADAQLAYLNVKNIAHVVITEDSDLVLFGCSKVLFKMDLDGVGTLVETAKLPLVMRCPIERYTFDKFRQMCIMSGCDYLASLPGIGLAKARQFISATQDSNIANALRKLPNYFNKQQLVVTDEYRESFLKAEATFKHQYVYDPINREMVRLNDTDDEATELALCCNAGEALDPEIAFQLALGNLDPFSLKPMDHWSPDQVKILDVNIKTNGWNQTAVSTHPSIWGDKIKQYLNESQPWQRKNVKKEQAIIAVPQTRPRKKIINLVSKYVPETQDESLTIESLSNMYCSGQAQKKQKHQEADSQETLKEHDVAMTEDAIAADLTDTQPKSPILKNKDRSNSYSVLRKLSKFPRTILGDSVVESRFFNNAIDDRYDEGRPYKGDAKKCGETSPILLAAGQRESDIKTNRNPFKVKQTVGDDKVTRSSSVDLEEAALSSSQKENSPNNSPKKGSVSPVLVSSGGDDRCRLSSIDLALEHVTECEFESEDSVIENTYPLETLVTPVDSQESFGESQTQMPIFKSEWKSKRSNGTHISNIQPHGAASNGISVIRRSNCRVSGLKRTSKASSNQPTLLSKFGFEKRPILKKSFVSN